MPAPQSACDQATIPVAGHPVEKGSVRELGAIETGNALELRAGEGGEPMEAGLVEASVAEKPHVREIHRRIEDAIREPCQSLEHASAQRERRGKGGA